MSDTTKFYDGTLDPKGTRVTLDLVKKGSAVTASTYPGGYIDVTVEQSLESTFSKALTDHYGVDAFDIKGVRKQKLARQPNGEWWFLDVTKPPKEQLTRPAYYEYKEQGTSSGQIAALPIDSRLALAQQAIIFEQLQEQAADKRAFDSSSDKDHETVQALNKSSSAAEVPWMMLAGDDAPSLAQVINGDLPVMVEKYVRSPGTTDYLVLQPVAPHPDKPGEFLWDRTLVTVETARAPTPHGKAVNQAKAIINNTQAPPEAKNDPSGRRDLMHRVSVTKISTPSQYIKPCHPDSLEAKSGTHNSEPAGNTPANFYFTKSGRDLEALTEENTIDGLLKSGKDYDADRFSNFKAMQTRYTSSSLQSIAANSSISKYFDELNIPMLSMKELGGDSYTPHLTPSALNVMADPSATQEIINAAGLGDKENHKLLGKIPLPFGSQEGISPENFVCQLNADGTTSKIGSSQPLIKGIKEDEIQNLKHSRAVQHQHQVDRGKDVIESGIDTLKSTLDFGLQVGLMVGGAVGLGQAFALFSNNQPFAAAGMFLSSIAIGAIGFSGVMSRVSAALNSDTLTKGLANTANAADQAFHMQGSLGTNAKATFENITLGGPSLGNVSI